MSQPYGSGTSVRFAQTSPDAQVYHGIVSGNMMTVYFPTVPSGTYVKREYVWDEADQRWEIGSPYVGELYAPGTGTPPSFQFVTGGVNSASGTATAVA